MVCAGGPSVSHDQASAVFILLSVFSVLCCPTAVAFQCLINVFTYLQLGLMLEVGFEIVI